MSKGCEQMAHRKGNKNDPETWKDARIQSSKDTCLLEGATFNLSG
jgi:hypothetical protein